MTNEIKVSSGEYAIAKEKPEAVVMITQYKHGHFQKNVKDRFSL